MLLGTELVVYHSPLGFPHALNDHLAGSLGGNTPKVPGLDLNSDHIPQFSMGQFLPCLFQAHLRKGIVNGLHHVLLHIHPDGTQLLVGIYHYVVAYTLMIPLISGHQSLINLLQHIALGYALLLFNEGDRCEKFRPVQLVGLLGLRVFSCCHYHSPL